MAVDEEARCFGGFFSLSWDGADVLRLPKEAKSARANAPKNHQDIAHLPYQMGSTDRFNGV
jgi:hypothetical protein